MEKKILRVYIKWPIFIYWNCSVTTDYNSFQLLPNIYHPGVQRGWGIQFAIRRWVYIRMGIIIPWYWNGYNHFHRYLISFVCPQCKDLVSRHCFWQCILDLQNIFDKSKWLTIALQVVRLAEHYVKFNIVPSFLTDPIHLEEVVREQIAGVEDPECSLAFEKFCTYQYSCLPRQFGGCRRIQWGGPSCRLQNKVW